MLKWVIFTHLVVDIHPLSCLDSPVNRRSIYPQVIEALNDTPVVFLQGPRQCGKTTLVKELLGEGHQAEYLTMDDASTLAAAGTDPQSFIDGLPPRVILDEIQRAPEVFLAIKRAVDRDRTPGRFLLTGSANALLLPKVAESLAGRMELLHLWPFSQGELAGRQESFIDACFGDELPSKKLEDSSWRSLVPKIAAGGYPEATLRKDARRHAWFSSYITTILERDVRDIANIQGLRELPRLLKLAAARSCNLLNLSNLARDAGLSLTTMQRYWALLEAVFFVHTIPAWSGNLSSRVSKAPKVLINDSGLLCHLIGLDTRSLETDEMMAGAVLESFLCTELMKQSTWSKTRPSIFHFRTHKQQEVDLVLEDAAGRLVGVEIKKTASPGSNDFKGLRHLSEYPKFHRGILLYTGETSVSFGDRLHAIPANAVWEW